jgi:hypothetical protein
LTRFGFFAMCSLNPDGVPIAAQHLAHARAGADAGKKLVLFLA